MGPARWIVGGFLAAHAAGRDLIAMDTGFRVPGMTDSELVEMVQRLGFAGLTWSATEPQWIRRIAEMAEQQKMRLVAVCCGAKLLRDGGLQPDPRVEGIVAALDGFSTLLWLHISSPDFRRSSEDGDDAAVPGLRALAERAAAAGVRIALYPHAGTWMERVEDAVRLAKKVDRPNVGVTFNLSHWLKTDGKDLDARLDAAMPWLYCVTINGASPEAGSSWAELIQPLGRGTYDWAELVRKLDQRGYTGPICLQLYGVGGQKQDNLKQSIDVWRAAFP